MMRSRFLLALCLFLFSASTFADVTLVRHPNRLTEWDTRNEYFLALLSLALEKTRGTDGDYLLEPSAQPMTQGRAINLLSSGQELDVLWSMTTRQREAQMLPVRIPLLKGLMGYRLFIIRAEDAVWFKGIKTLDQLRDVRAGQGHDWPDTDILRANGFRVETTTEYEYLFQMLQAGRFDFLPRALNEPWEEVSARPELNLAVESSLLLYYPTANYFFFQRDNKALADRVQRGLEIAIADGSFDKLFNQHPVNAFALNHAELHQRRVLKLVNPLLPVETPLDRKELWWQVPVNTPDTRSESAPAKK